VAPQRPVERERQQHADARRQGRHARHLGWAKICGFAFSAETESTPAVRLFAQHGTEHTVVFTWK
jgi:hypothetical protein